MKACCGVWRKRAIVAGCLLLTLHVSLAQKKPTSNSADSARSSLIEKGHALESRGRPDMAIQLWQQILLSDPDNVEALAGLARDLKLIGSADKSNEALNHLRRINPNDPNIARIEALSSTRAESDQLKQAGELAKQGRVDDAMRIYKQLYGDRPPDGDIAMAYYQTLYGTSNGKQAAVAGMRALAERNPGDQRFAVELGVMLTYDARTRPEGMRILAAHPKDPNAVTGYRQALIWDAANPASAAELRQFLKDHPQDTEIAGHLKEDETKLAQMNSGIARTPEERAAFAALNSHHLDEAQKRFTEILEKQPDNGRATAGMGFLRMQQSNFGAAISYLTQAEQDGYKDRVVENALEASRFYYTLGEASQAFDDNRLDEAEAKYKASLAKRPRSPEALSGLAGLYVKQQKYPAAIVYYEQLVKVQPANSTAWRGLFLAYARMNENAKAMAVSARFPSGVRASLAKDPEYLRTLATIYQSQGRTADAQRALNEALSLPFPDNGTTLKADTKLQYAGVLMQVKRYDQAAALYVQILNEDTGNLGAWMGLVSAHHELGRDTQAIADVQKMPAATYESALSDAGFLSMLGAIYQQANQFEIAQGLLERSEKMQIAAGGRPTVALQLQLAGIYLQRNLTDQAYAIYHQLLLNNPDNADCWNGLVSTLLATNRNTEALQEIAVMPASVRRQLETSIEFVQSEASLYAATGDTEHAVVYMKRVEVHYAALKTAPPASIEIQNAWLLFNIGNDRALYPTLMRLGGRSDLTAKQRETVQDIWANWSVRRAAAAMDNGNVYRAVDILDAASQAFPDNMTVRKAVAGGYMRVGRTKESLALFKTVPMQDATAGDFQAAIGAALTANDKSYAETWLRQALERYPRDPAILTLAARYEQARGDNQRAADYYRASLAAMPKTSPVDKLAHELVYPEQETRARRAVTAADLQHLLDPDYEPFAKTTKLPPLPAYGADPYNGSAPVVPTPAQQQSKPTSEQTAPTDPWANTPSPTSYQTPSTPAPQPNGPQMYRQSFSETQGTSHVRNLGVYTGPEIRLATGRASLTGSLQTRVRFEAVSLSAGGEPQASAQSGSQPIIEQPHSMASDAWKGLVFSLMADGRNAEAYNEIQKMPPDVRRLLEDDVEFEQGEANLYMALGDVPHAMEYMNRVEDFYLLRRIQPPGGMAVQHAWLLYNIKDDLKLYPVLVRLDARQDLTADQRQQVETIWADWAVRRAATAMDQGNMLRGVEILQAASEDYPDNLTVRRAVAGAYTRVGRAADSLALFKTIPMQDASAGDFEGAVSAAIAATDMAQAEAWLRQALARYPSDPGILGLAARFEQARGNSARATDFWRAALAAMPPGSSIPNLESTLVYAPGAYTTPRPGEMKRLLDPRNDPLPRTKVPPLPSYAPSSSNYGSNPSQYGSRSSSAPVPPVPAPAQKPESQWIEPPSSEPLPLPPPVPTNQETAPNSQSAPTSNPPATVPQTSSPPSNAPIYVPRGAQAKPPGEPTMVEQAAKQQPTFNPVSNTAPASKADRNPSSAKSSQRPSSYEGQISLPPDETVVTTDTESVPAGYTSRTQRKTSANSPDTMPAGPIPAPQLRIASQPMGSVAAQVQALFAEQTDSQLTQGSATGIHATPGRPAQPLPPLNTPASNQAQYSVAQYTPSAQEAATGAYSAPKQQAQQTEQPAAPAKPPAAPRTSRRARRKAQAAQTMEGQTTPESVPSTPTLANSPAPENPPQVQPGAELPTELPSQQTQSTSGTGLTDEELQQRNLPPLRGPWVRVQRQNAPLSPRDEAEMQLRAIESGYSAWLGGTGYVNFRTGALGFDHLAALESPFEASVAMGYNARLTFIAKPVFLDSGQADGSAIISVNESTTSGSKLVQIPEPIGTLTSTDTTPPGQQNAVAIGGEVQLAFAHLAIAGGYTGEGFLVATETGRFLWKPGNGPFTFNLSREPVTDSQLSYGGLRDPAGNTLATLGQIWGGVIANDGHVQFAHGDAMSGFYFGAGAQYLAGYTVETNKRVDGSGGAYWRLITNPEYGNLSIGANFFAMYYANNQDAFTHGMGGYFSPQGYFLANVPFTWAAHYGTRWHYNILGAVGVQAFQESANPLWPLAVDKGLETSQNNAMLPAMTSVGPNYDLRGQVAYQIGSHWFAGGFFGANNTRNYQAASAGFFVRYMFRSQPSTVTTPTGLFPSDGLRPFTVP